MLTRFEELSSLIRQIHGVEYQWFEELVYLDPEHLIFVNTSQRDGDSAAGLAFRNWWLEYFIFGSNGGGDYFCLRLDGSPEVWLLCTESWKKRVSAASIQEFVDESIEEFRLGGRG
jgi:hypothetical protein